MRRVAVIGCSGAGKTRFSVDLAAATGLPLVHLDAEYWRPGWTEPPAEVWRSRHGELIAADAWILDGNYGGTLDERLARADTVFWFDPTTAAALLGVAQRTLMHFGRARPDMAPGCPERIDRDFLNYVLAFRRRTRPRIAAALERRAGSVVLHRFERRGEARRFLRGLEGPGKIVHAGL